MITTEMLLRCGCGRGGLYAGATWLALAKMSAMIRGNWGLEMIFLMVAGIFSRDF